MKSLVRYYSRFPATGVDKFMQNGTTNISSFDPQGSKESSQPQPRNLAKKQGSPKDLSYLSSLRKG